LSGLPNFTESDGTQRTATKIFRIPKQHIVRFGFCVMHRNNLPHYGPTYVTWTASDARGDTIGEEMKDFVKYAAT
jgi:hypothetical protein